MKYDLDKYRRTIKPVIENWFNSKHEVKHEDEIGMIAIATGCPIVVVGYLMLEAFGPNNDISRQIESLEKFYNVTGVKHE